MSAPQLPTGKRRIKAIDLLTCILDKQVEESFIVLVPANELLAHIPIRVEVEELEIALRSLPDSGIPRTLVIEHYNGSLYLLVDQNPSWAVRADRFRALNLKDGV